LLIYKIKLLTLCVFWVPPPPPPKKKNQTEPLSSVQVESEQWTIHSPRQIQR
jgi:hypothetical protein